MGNFRSRQRGSMLSLVLTVLFIGVVAYFALRSHSATQTAPGGEQEMVSCTKLVSDLVGRTGGIGPDYKKGYDAMPANCRSMLPPPAPARGLPEGQ